MSSSPGFTTNWFCGLEFNLSQNCRFLTYKLRSNDSLGPRVAGRAQGDGVSEVALEKGPSHANVRCILQAKEAENWP